MLDQVLAAIEHVESRGNPAVVSRDGCVGLMQVNPKWSKYTKAQLLDPATNRAEGRRLFLYWHHKAHYHWAFSIAAYRCGWGGLTGKCGTGYAKHVCKIARCER
jgi:soluble lytic murein transglycosylase-like protein